MRLAIDEERRRRCAGLAVDQADAHNAWKVAMQNLNVSIIIGTLALLAALPAVAQSPSRASIPSSSGSEAAVQSPAAVDPTESEDAYVQKAQARMGLWEQRLIQLDSTVGSDKELSDSAEDAVNKAWIAAEATYDELQPTGAEGGQGARIAFEKAMQQLAETWHKVHPADK